MSKLKGTITVDKYEWNVYGIRKVENGYVEIKYGAKAAQFSVKLPLNWVLSPGDHVLLRDQRCYSKPALKRAEWQRLWLVAHEQ